MGNTRHHASVLKFYRHCKLTTASLSLFVWTDQLSLVQRLRVWRSKCNPRRAESSTRERERSWEHALSLQPDRVWHEVAQSRLPFGVQHCNLSDHCSQKPPCRLLFLLSRFLILPSMLQSSLSGQVASVGMLVCAAKQNRCRKILAEVGEKGRQGRVGSGKMGCVGGLNSNYL